MLQGNRTTNRQVLRSGACITFLQFCLLNAEGCSRIETGLLNTSVVLCIPIYMCLYMYLWHTRNFFYFLHVNIISRQEMLLFRLSLPCIVSIRVGETSVGEKILGGRAIGSLLPTNSTGRWPLPNLYSRYIVCRLEQRVEVSRVSVAKRFSLIYKGTVQQYVCDGRK